MKRILFGSVALLGLIAPAFAQVNTVPQNGVNVANLRENTYIATMNGLVPAASATDFFCIAGSASKNIAIEEISVSGTAGTLVTTPIFIRRITGTLNTGTASTATSGPRAFKSGGATVTASIVGYDSTGGNPTVTGTTALFDGEELTLPVSGTSAMPANAVTWKFGTALDAYAQRLFITSGSTTTEYCLNLGAVSITSGKLYGHIIWTEF